MYRPLSISVAGASPFLDVESIIRGLTQDFCTAFNTGNYDQAAALYAVDGLLLCPNHEVSQGPREIERRFRQLSEQGYEDLRCETTRVDYSGDMAIEIGRYTAAVRRPDGTVITDRGNFVHAWRRLGVWRIAADSWNSTAPLRR